MRPTWNKEKDMYDHNATMKAWANGAENTRGIGTVWTGYASVRGADGKEIGRCLDTVKCMAGALAIEPAADHAVIAYEADVKYTRDNADIKKFGTGDNGKSYQRKPVATKPRKPRLRTTGPVSREERDAIADWSRAPHSPVTLNGKPATISGTAQRHASIEMVNAKTGEVESYITMTWHKARQTVRCGNGRFFTN